jgi:transcriptional regulator with XRE-family HTH domain
MTSEVKSREKRLQKWSNDPVDLARAFDLPRHMSTIKVRVGREIARRRASVGMTQAELAERVGVQPETISRLETGARAATLERLASLSVALGVDVHELFRAHGGDDPRQRATARLLRFASGLSVTEIQLVAEVGAAVVARIRRYSS